jgi:predicted metalloprotease
MKWEGRRKSDNIEDRRMGTPQKVAIGGGLAGIIFLVIQLLMGGDGQQIAEALQSQLQQQAGTTQEGAPLTEEDRRLGDFVATVLADTEDVWHSLFERHGGQYREPKLVLFRDAVQSRCGGATAQSGPFYCPADETVYMDLTFFETLRTRFGAKGGDFAIAYVIGHEIGHHVQHLLGTLRKSHEARQGLSQAEGNRVQVAVELQADFYAGIWAHYVRKYLEEGDIEEALSAAAAVGDDAIQKRTRGHVVQESFTHGTSQQRMEWFMRGFKSGDIRDGDTFAKLLNN